MARTGLRMMPTSPSSSLRFRTAGFPQYSSKADISDRAFPHGLPPSFVASVILPRTEARLYGPECHRRSSGIPALPQGSSLRSGLCCPGPSSLNRPHPPHWPTRRNFPALRVICTVHAVRALHPPRQSASGSELSLNVPSQHVALLTPRRVRRLHRPSLQRRDSPSPSLPIRLGTLGSPTTIRFLWAALSRLSGSLIRYDLLSCSPPLADLTGRRTLVPPPSQPRLLLPSFRTSRSPFSPSGITTVVPGRFHWQIFHLLEQQLASLHRDRRPACLSPAVLWERRGEGDLGAERGGFFAAPS